jgi:TonB family protein
MRSAVLGLVLSLATGALAEGPAPAAILLGTVVDAATEAPVPEAVVVAHSPALIGEQEVRTDAAGAFEMTFLPPGTYSLSVRRDGFVPFAPEALVLKVGKVHVRIAVLPVPPPVSLTASAIEFNETMIAPAMISGPAPEYTQEAIERGVQGNMQVRCVVTIDGQVRGCKVVKGLPFMNGAVVDALEKRKYKPAVAQGKAVDVYYTFNIRLKLPSQ